MLTHETIWNAIDRLARSCGYSTSGLAKKAGLDPTSFNRSKRTGPDGKPRWPSTESLARVLEATGANITEFMELLVSDEIASDHRPRIPVIGYAQAGKEGYFDEAGFPTGEGWDFIHFPTASPKPNLDQRIYALEVAGDSMLPLFRHGDRLVLSPDSTVRRGDRVVIKTNTGEIMTKELLRQTAGKIEVRSLNPNHENIILTTDRVIWMARIIWVSQ
ncbi:MAG: helix-turn-helix transcriptional regulator [Pseudobdellovibrionaceae bacterium]|jgi:phage repressor protein C with HTH and peptisase S24 domain|nr:helix-turn-helix transcriptional regulator [Pseudobdellovibrionaceae bacterium]